MMITTEQRFCKARKLFEAILVMLESGSDAERRIDQVERNLFTQLMKLGMALLQEFIGMAGEGDQGPTVEREGKTLKRFQGVKTRVYRSIFGVLKVTRWVYGQRDGQAIKYSKVDAQLGLPKLEQSYVLEDWQQQFAVQKPYSCGMTMLATLLGIKSTVATAEATNGILGGVARDFQEQQKVNPKEEAEIIVVTADGKGVPMRSTLEERMGLPPTPQQKFHEKKQAAKADQRAQGRLSRGQVRTRKQMAFVAAVYTIDRWKRDADHVLDELLRKQNAKDRPRPKQKMVMAELTHYYEDERIDAQPELFKKLSAQAKARGASKKQVVCLMDGQRSLWSLKETQLSEAVGILDIFHVMEWMWKASYCLFKESSREAENWVLHQIRLILEGKVGYAIGNMKRQLTGLKAVKKEKLNSAIRYFENSRKYMRYDEYLAAGYPIGSGVVEGACRHLVKDRMELTGMRWHVEGAQAMLSTRAVYLNGQWDAFIEHRIEAEQKELYAQAA